MSGQRTENTMKFNSQRLKDTASLHLPNLLCGIPHTVQPFNK